eukprot:3556133-Amphidinium_carterae.1
MSTLTEELKALVDGIAALDKSVAEATATRKEEHEEYNSLMTADGAAKDSQRHMVALKMRLKMQGFYNPKLYKPAPKRVLTSEETIYSNFGGGPLLPLAHGAKSVDIGALAPTPAPGGIANTGVLAFVQLHVAQPAAPESFEAYAKKAQELPMSSLFS